jgi:hypothetical protein
MLRFSALAALLVAVGSTGSADAALGAPAAVAEATMAPMPGTGSMPAMPMSGATAQPEATPPAAPDTAMPMNASAMHSPVDLADAMAQDGSGTSWSPASTQMFGWMHASGRDMQMTHGVIFPRYVSTGSDRGARRADAPNWFMFMGSHLIGERSQFGYTAMISADSLTENVHGYPLLFQTGESAYGAPLHDAQHPHDLFSELAVTYSVRLGDARSVYVYAGYPGEPALGPTVFMHRRIAYDMADSTIGHHWEDATHIQFGVVTLGYAPLANLKLEASTFTGREPNEIRTNFDPIHLDSYSGRLSWNPTADLATEISFGFIASPEALEPLTNQHRFVASVLYNKPLGPDRNFYAGLIFGQNLDSTGVRTSSYLAETDYQAGRNTGYARIELGTRSATDLVIPVALPATIYDIGAYTLGAVHDLTRNPAAADIGIGAQFTLGSKSAGLAATYGAGTPLGYEVFFRIRPPDMAHTMNAMAR